MQVEAVVVVALEQLAEVVEQLAEVVHTADVDKEWSCYYQWAC